jgi:phytanoyl-CoA hydroxylase
MIDTLSRPAPAVTDEDVAAFARDGFLIVRGLLNAAEVAELRTAFDELHARGNIPGCFKALPVEEARAKGDILLAYPRMMHPHRVSDVAMRFMLHPAFAAVLTGLLGEPPIAAQSMFYWKPPTARGQAFHQDNFYLKVHPGTCVASWVALDEIDEENGCLFVAPGSHRLDIFCPEEADTSVSFTAHYVPVPEGLEQVPVRMAPGDTLFFGGNLIHGSWPNHSTDRFRRSFICHYAGESAHELSKWYFPLYTMDGKVVERETATGGGPCGDEAKGPH